MSGGSHFVDDVPVQWMPAQRYHFLSLPACSIDTGPIDEGPRRFATEHGSQPASRRFSKSCRARFDSCDSKQCESGLCSGSMRRDMKPPKISQSSCVRPAAVVQNKWLIACGFAVSDKHCKQKTTIPDRNCRANPTYVPDRFDANRTPHS